MIRYRDFLDISHALSLIDTFWVKPVDSRLEWEDLSLYTHPFNDVIAKTAFEGGLHGRHLSTTSPEYGTDGSFAKCWIREDGTIKMLKRGSSGASNVGLEPYSEFIPGRLLKNLRISLSVMGSGHTTAGSVRYVIFFTSEEYGFLPYAAVDTGNTTVSGIFEESTGTWCRSGNKKKCLSSMP